MPTPYIIFHRKPLPPYPLSTIRGNLGSKMGLLRKIIKKPHHTTNMPCQIKSNENLMKVNLNRPINGS